MARSTRIILTGTTNVLANLARTLVTTSLVTRAGVEASVLIVLAAARYYTPVDTGELVKSSGTTVISTPNHITGYINYAKAYALYVHEIPPPPALSWKGRSARHDPPTQWKFLERALKEKADAVLEAIVLAARVGMK